jgi:hypothetical protein
VKKTPDLKFGCSSIKYDPTYNQDIDYYEHGHSFMSPKKEMQFARDITSYKNSPPVTKTPVLNKCLYTPCHPSDLFEDDATKAEFSNLFFSKSNQLGNL